MTGESDLSVLLATLDPVLDPEPYAYLAVAELPDDLTDVIAMVREDEGVTLVASAHAAHLAGEDAVAVRRITLGAQSALTSVGLTAAVSAALTDHGISCNVVAGFRHDHLFVPPDDAERAVAVLKLLGSARA